MYKRLIISGLMKTVSNYPIPNTFRMKVKCALYVEIESEEELATLDFASLPQPVMVMGGGSNLLFTKDFPGTVLHYGVSSVISSEAEKSPALDVAVVFEVQTFYEKMFLEMGLPITYLAFCIDHEGPYAFPGEAFDHDYWLEAEGPRRSFSHQPNKKG